MKFAMLTTLLAAVGIVGATPAPNGAVVKRSTDVVIHYAGEEGPSIYSFGECIPVKIDGAPITSVMVTQLAKCYAYTDGSCQYQVNPFPIIIPANVNVPNTADFIGFFAGSGICYPFP